MARRPPLVVVRTVNYDRRVFGKQAWKWENQQETMRAWTRKGKTTQVWIDTQAPCKSCSDLVHKEVVFQKSGVNSQPSQKPAFLGGHFIAFSFIINAFD